MTKKIIVLFILQIIFLMSFALPIASLAQEQNTGYVPLAPIEGFIEEGQPVDLSIYVQNAVKILIGVAGILAVLVIMIGGIQYITTDSFSGKEEGKERIAKALLGLLLAIAAWLVLNTINPDLLGTNISIEKIPAPVVEGWFYTVKQETFYKKGQQTITPTGYTGEYPEDTCGHPETAFVKTYGPLSTENACTAVVNSLIADNGQRQPPGCFVFLPCYEVNK